MAAPLPCVTRLSNIWRVITHSAFPLNPNMWGSTLWISYFLQHQRSHSITSVTDQTWGSEGRVVLELGCGDLRGLGRGGVTAETRGSVGEGWC